MKPKPQNLVIPSQLCLWRIEGEACNDSGGGDVTIHALTADSSVPPNPDDAIEQASGGRYAFYRVRSVELVAEADLPQDGCMPGTDWPCADLTGASLPGNVVDALGALMSAYGAVWVDYRRERLRAEQSLRHAERN